MVCDVQIVAASAEMLPEILRLEEACFSAPWTRKMLEAELTGNPFAHFLVAIHQEDKGGTTGGIVGYHCFWIVFEELRLMNLAVRESMRKRGIGQALVTEAIRMGMAHAASRAVLEVRASNEAARSLYQRMGFALVSIGCHVGLRARGGTQGVGRATTNAVVSASVAVLAIDFFLTKFLITLMY